MTTKDPNAILEAIRLQLDGQAWDSETCSNIANILTDAGYVVREPIEED